MILPMERVCESASLYPAVVIIVRAVLMQRHGILILDSHIRRKWEDRIIELLEPAYVTGFFLWGELFELENQVELMNLLRRIKETYPAKDICVIQDIYDVDSAEGGKVAYGCGRRNAVLY